MAQSLAPSHVSLVTEETEEAKDDLMASAPNLWPPRSVVKRNRRTATAIWIVMLIGFIAYIVYIVVDTLDARSNPASHVRIKQEHYKFPDIAICANLGEGCYTYGPWCFYGNSSEFWMDSQYGFMEEELEVDENSLLIEEEYPNCKVLPLSKLTVNETAMNSEENPTTHFSVQIVGLWDELDDGTGSAINTRFVKMFFIDVDSDLDEIGKEVNDGDIPYGIIDTQPGERFEVISSSVLISMTEFRPIGSNGQELERQRTYTQRTTSTTMAWDWTYNSTLESAFLYADILIPKFEYMLIEEVDPVDVWAIIGAIGGVWQIVCVGFGIFFVFSVKQPPDLKMRDFKKAVRKSLDAGRRLTQSVSRQSQDVDIDAHDEDLPDGWVKRQHANGSVYYFHVPTGTSQDRCPNPLEATRTGHGRIQPAHDPRGSGGLTVAATNTMTAGVGVRPSELPQGWLKKTDHQGQTYYVDTVNQSTQWDPPVASAILWNAPPPQAISGGVHGATGSEPSQGLVEGAPVSEPSSKTDGRTSSRERRANRRQNFIREISRPRRRVASQQGSEPDDHTPGVIPAPSNGTLSNPSGGRGEGSFAASAGGRTGAHADPSLQ